MVNATGTISTGMVNGFRWVVPPGSWTTVTWDLASPGDYEEVGLKFPPAVTQAYIGSFEIDP